MSDIPTALQTILEDNPELRDEFKTLLEIDADGPWEFDDIPLDSGTFGETVSRDIVEKVDGQYRLADREAVRAVLHDEPVPEEQQTAKRPDVSEYFDCDWDALRPLGLGLIIVFLARIYMYPQVFRSEAITFLGNDPYFYRYWLLELARENAGLFAVPEGIQVGEPLLVAVLWTVTKIAGGSAETGFAILAWYPVVAAILSAVFLYLLAVTLTRDRRIGLATLVMVAFTPVLGYRMALGFGDHHAFDSVWLALTMVAVAWLVARPNRSIVGTAVGIFGVAVGVSAQVLAWEAGALLLVPLALYGATHGYSVVREGGSALRELGPVTLGVALGGVISGIVHLQGGWQTKSMILPPTLLAGGLVGIIIVAEGGRKFGGSARVVGGGILAVGLVAFVMTFVFFPDFTTEAVNEFSQIAGQQDIAENTSIFSTDLGLFAGPFFFFGLSLFFGLPYLIWGFWRGITEARPAWVLASSYGLVFFVLGTIRVRFAGQLALIMAVFSGLAFVHLYAIVTDRDRPAVLDGTIPDQIVGVSWSRPDRSTVFALVGVFLLVGGLGTMMTPLRVDLLTYSDEQYEAAMYMEGAASEENLEYPDSYVFSQWGDNRMYNALVSGESQSYGFARGNYNDFVVSTNESEWYQRLQERGYIVTTDLRDTAGLESDAIYRQLHEDYGVGTSHYRVLYSAPDGSVKVFEPVQGATIVGEGRPAEEVTLTGHPDTASGPESVERTTETTDNGWYAVTVPVPGTYDGPTASHTVTEADVRSGSFSAETSSNATWPLTAGQGPIIFDTTGGHHGRITGATWSDTESAQRLTFDGDGSVTIPASDGLNGTGGFTLSAQVETKENVDYRETVKWPRLVSKAKTTKFENTSGYQIAMSRGRIVGLVGDGNQTARVVSGYIDDGEPHSIELRLDGDTVTLYVDENQVDQARYTGEARSEYPFVIGAGSSGGGNYVGHIHSVEFENLSS